MRAQIRPQRLPRDRRGEGPSTARSVPAVPKAGRGIVRALVRRGARSDQSPAVTHKLPGLADPTLCAGCGAVFSRKTWRRSGRRTARALRADAPWSYCPACRLAGEHRWRGRVLATGTYLSEHADEIRRRIENVASRAAYTQPERRIVAVTARGSALEILTTSQKLAHRIAHELKKAFHGEVSYAWSDRDGQLLAVWHRDTGRPTRH
jgi:NMD protein affecting ribosome stability and mRNA decay